VCTGRDGGGVAGGLDRDHDRGGVFEIDPGIERTPLDRRLIESLEDGARTELGAGPLVLQDRFQNQAGMRMMHAQEISSSAVLTQAIREADTTRAVDEAARISESFPGELPIVIGPDGVSWSGPTMPAGVVVETKGGDAPVLIVKTPDELGTVALAPVGMPDRWEGAAGVWIPMLAQEAIELSALTRSDVLITAPDGTLGAYTGRAAPAMGLLGLLAELPESEAVEQLTWEGERYIVVSAGVPGRARVTFVRSLSEELAIVPALRSVGLLVLALSAFFALLVGAWVATRFARPVHALAKAAQQITEGNFEVPVERSAVAEVDQVASAFETMRDALAARIADLSDANEELENRQARLGMLQAELVQRDRLSVAGVRNCLEILRQRVADDPEARDFADRAIDELLRMHELAEHMLDLYRPGDREGDCDAIQVAEDALGSVGDIRISVASDQQRATLKVTDDGPGIEDEVLPHLFDPFFTTKADLRGVGLGLFTADGLARTHGGRIIAGNRSDGTGADPVAGLRTEAAP
jgi:signal transduction histidine kinase